MAYRIERILGSNLLISIYLTGCVSCMSRLSVRYTPYIFSSVVFSLPVIVATPYFTEQTMYEKFSILYHQEVFLFSYLLNFSCDFCHISLNSPCLLNLISTSRYHEVKFLYIQQHKMFNFSRSRGSTWIQVQ